jgi:hypothetical protein
VLSSLWVDLMFVYGGAVPDEDDFMRRYLGCNAKGWHTLRDRLLHLQKIYRDGNDKLRSPLVDKGLKEAQRRRYANSMAGMISQTKRQMTAKVVREFPKVSNFAVHTHGICQSTTSKPSGLSGNRRRSVLHAIDAAVPVLALWRRPKNTLGCHRWGNQKCRRTIC